MVSGDFKYKEQTGDANAPNGYTTPDGYKLGSWQSHQRQNYKKRKLTAESIKRLEEIGFKWDPYEELFEKGFQETLNTGNRQGMSMPLEV